MRLDELQRRVGEKVSIEWKSFLLRVEPKASDRDEFVEYTRSWLRPAELEPSITFNIWQSDAPPPSSSLPAQVAAKLVTQEWPDLSPSYHHRLLQAYFTENRDISDGDELIALAVDVGADEKTLRDQAAAHVTDLTQAVLDDHNSAIESGVTAVPTVVMAGAFPVSGAQPVETYERLVDAMLDRNG